MSCVQAGKLDRLVSYPVIDIKAGNLDHPPRNLGHYIIILQNIYWEMLNTLDLSLIAVSQSMDNYYSALSVFS